MIRKALLTTELSIVSLLMSSGLTSATQTPTPTPSPTPPSQGAPFNLPFVPAGYEMLVVGGVVAAAVAAFIFYYLKRIRRRVRKTAYTVEIPRGRDTPIMVFRIPIKKKEAIGLQIYQVDARRLLLRQDKQRILKELVFPVEIKQESIRCHYKEESIEIEGEPAKLTLIPINFKK